MIGQNINTPAPGTFMKKIEVGDVERAADIGDIGTVEALGEFFTGDHGAVFDLCEGDDERVRR